MTHEDDLAAQEWHQKARQLALGDDFGQAITYYCKAITAKPYYPEAYYGRGLAYSHKANVLAARGRAMAAEAVMVEAVADFTKAIAMRSDFADAYRHRGVAFLFCHKYEFARDDLDQSLALEPGHADSLAIRGEIHYRSGEHEQAIRDLRQAIEQGPSNSRILCKALWSLCQALLQLERLDEASSCMEDYAALAQDASELRAHLDCFLEEKRRIESRWAATPYDRGNHLKLPVWWLSARWQKTYDVFLSYKSEDAAVVRQVADVLLANGLKVWFAEYLILLTGRERFQRAIDVGLARTRRGIAFTRDLYSRSEHCRSELKQLLDPHNCGPDKILEVKLIDEPLTHPECPTLSGAHSVLFVGDVCDLLRSIGRELSLSLDIPVTLGQPTCGSSTLYQDDHDFVVDVSGWERDKTRDVPQFEGFLGHHHVTWNLVVGTWPLPPKKIPAAGETLSDRVAFDDAISFAAKYLGERGAKPRGCHLFFKDGYSHVALTYWYVNGWARRYIVVLPDPRTGQSTEFNFTFAFFGSFRDYCRSSHLMDRVVYSLQWL